MIYVLSSKAELLYKHPNVEKLNCLYDIKKQKKTKNYLPDKHTNNISVVWHKIL